MNIEFSKYIHYLCIPKKKTLFVPLRLYVLFENDVKPDREQHGRNDVGAMLKLIPSGSDKVSAAAPAITHSMPITTQPMAIIFHFTIFFFTSSQSFYGFSPILTHLILDNYTFLKKKYIRRTKRTFINPS
jgi:hypothetical protein